MTSTVIQNRNQQIICTTPERYMRGHGNNPVTEKLSDYRPMANRNKELRRHKRDKSISRLMNCKTVDKFDAPPRGALRNADYVKGRPDNPKVPQNTARLLKPSDVQAWVQAGAEIHVDPWRFEYKIMYHDTVKGHCRYGDIVDLCNAGLIQKIRLQHGYEKYIRK